MNPFLSLRSVYAMIVYIIILTLLLKVESQQRRDKMSKKDNSASDLELSLRFLERARMNEAAKEIEKKGIIVKGFYHTSTWQTHWSDVITEQLRIMDGVRYKNKDSLNSMTSRVWSSILSISKEVHMTVAGSDQNYQDVKALVKNLGLVHESRIHLVNNHTMQRSKYMHANDIEKKVLREQANRDNLSEGEYATMIAMHQYCKAQVNSKQKTFIYYLHNKGGCCSKDTPSPVKDWREEMNTFHIEFPSNCARALLAGYQTCGVEYQIAHYSGNYFWADCDHVAALPGLWDPINNAYACEYFIFNTSLHHRHREQYAEQCGYNMFHCHINHYAEKCPREKYLPVILKLLASEELLPTSTAPPGRNVQWATDHCHKAHSSPYLDMPNWKKTNFVWA